MEKTPETVKQPQRKQRRESNPMLIKELRGRMRGARAFVVLTTYLLFLSCFTSVIYYAYTANASGPGGGPDMAYLGKTVFATVAIIEIFMVTFITPAFTAGAISGERERQTYEVLRTTLLSARKLVFGKLSSALTYVFLLILAAVPLQSLAFVLGGVVIEELAVALLVFLVTAFTFAAVGMLFSAFARTTLVSTVLTYVFALLMTVGLPLLMLVGIGVIDALWYDYDPPTWIIEAMFMYLVFFTVSLSPISAAIGTEIILEEEGSILYFWQTIDSGHRILIPSFWIPYVIIYVLIALVLLLVTILKVRRQEIK